MDYLRLKKRKLYKLVAELQVPCTKVAGKWLFSRADLGRWLLAGIATRAIATVAALDFVRR